MRLYYDIYVLAKCIELFLENMNTPGNYPIFTFEVYMFHTRAKSFLLKVKYPEPFPMLYEGFDINKMISNLYNGHGRFGNKERNYYQCGELLEFSPECSGPFIKRPKTNSTASGNVDTTRRRRVCQYYTNEYYKQCDEITCNCIRVATIICSDTSSIFMNPLVWSGNSGDIFGF